jgi:hypothetical protein
VDIIVAANSLISSELLYDEYLSRIYIKNKEYIPETKDNLLNVRYQVLGEGLLSIELKNKKIEKFLEFISLMDCSNISKDFLISYEDEDFVNDVLNQLNSYSLITIDQFYNRKNYMTFSINKYAVDILRLKSIRNRERNK